MSLDPPPLPDADEMGVAAELLLDQGKVQAARVLIEAAGSGMELVDSAVMYGGHNYLIYNLTLDVPVSLCQGLTDEVIENIREAVNLTIQRHTEHVRLLHVRPVLPPRREEWRKELAERLKPQVTNQASVGPRMEKPLVEDRCQFRSQAELDVYRALKRQWAKMKLDDSMAIAPNPALVVPNMHTTEPDFLVMFRGRVGILHVDGPHHRGRLANEATRDRMYRRHGIRWVDRIVVEDTTKPEDLDTLVEQFLKELIRPN